MAKKARDRTFCGAGSRGKSLERIGEGCELNRTPGISTGARKYKSEARQQQTRKTKASCGASTLLTSSTVFKVRTSQQRTSLEKTNEVLGAPMCRVLSVEYSIPYLVKRHVALRRAEVPVESASTLREALTLMRLGEFDVAVLGHAIPEAERNRIAEALLELKPSMRLIMMYAESISNADRADAVLSLGGEQHLVPTIKSLTARMKAARGADVLKKAAGF